MFFLFEKRNIEARVGILQPMTGFESGYSLWLKEPVFSPFRDRIRFPRQARETAVLTFRNSSSRPRISNRFVPLMAWFHFSIRSAQKSLGLTFVLCSFSFELIEVLKLN